LKNLNSIAHAKILKKPDQRYKDRAEIRDRFLRLIIGKQIWSFGVRNR
jgi:hypothetical protein